MSDEPAVEAARLVSSLGASWTTHRLYPNPVEQPAFRRGVDAVNELDEPMLFEVAAGWFLQHGEEIARDRDGVERLARALFVHDVEAIKVGTEKMSAEQLRDFFDLLAAEDSEIQEKGGLANAINATGIGGVVVLERGLLTRKRGGESEGERQGHSGAESMERTLESELATMVDKGAEPEQVAEKLVAQTQGDPDRGAEEYLSAYRELYDDESLLSSGYAEEFAELLAPYWASVAPKPAVHTFVDAYFLLPEDYRVAVIATFLANADDAMVRTFLDQFSGYELASVGPSLDEAQQETLVGYAQAAVGGEQAGAEFLLSVLTSERHARDARAMSANRVAEFIQRIDPQSVDEIPEMHAELAVDPTELGVELLVALMECETRPRRFLRLARVWTGRMAAHLRNGDFEGAAATFDAVENNRPYDEDVRPIIEQTLEKMATAELLGVMVSRFVSEGGSEAAVGLLRRFGPSVADRLIERMAVEEDRVLRRGIIEVLAAIGADNPGVLTSRVRDPRWYVVRNMATALGKTGRLEVAGTLVRLLGHADYRVRVEAMRAMTPIMDSKLAAAIAKALDDGHERVRHTAATLLRASEHPGVDDALVRLLAEEETSASLAERLVHLMGERKSPATRATLEELTKRRFAVGKDRSLAKAAKEALRGWS